LQRVTSCVRVVVAAIKFERVRTSGRVVVAITDIGTIKCLKAVRCIIVAVPEKLRSRTSGCVPRAAAGSLEHAISTSGCIVAAGAVWERARTDGCVSVSDAAVVKRRGTYGRVVVAAVIDI